MNRGARTVVDSRGCVSERARLKPREALLPHSRSFRAKTAVVASSLFLALFACAGAGSIADPCSDEDTCEQGLTCSPVTKLCVIRGTEGSPCSSPSDCAALACIKGACARPTELGNECETSAECSFGISENGPVCAKLPGKTSGVCAAQCDQASSCVGNTTCCKLGELPVTACVTRAFCP